MSLIAIIACLSRPYPCLTLLLDSLLSCFIFEYSACFRLSERVWPTCQCVGLDLGSGYRLVDLEFGYLPLNEFGQVYE